MILEITKTIKDGDMEIENHIKLENGLYTHRQIEKIDGRIFMRIKTRRIFEIMPQ